MYMIKLKCIVLLTIYVFYPGVIAEEQGGARTILYEHCEMETLNFSHETWRYTSGAELYSLLTPFLTLSSKMNELLDMMFKHFGNKPFLRYSAQCFL